MASECVKEVCACICKDVHTMSDPRVPSSNLEFASLSVPPLKHSKMEVPESLFARLEDDIIVHIASALPLNDASNFMLTCKRTHTLATTRVDTWWNRSLLTSRSLWCAIGVVKALVETPDGSDFDIDAYDRLIQDLEPHEAIRDLVEAPSRLCSAAERLKDKGVTKKMLHLACGLICGTIKCEPQHRRKVSQRAHFCVPPYADIPDVWPQMITQLLARDAKHYIKIATLLYNEGGDPASLLELDDFPPGFSAAMGISNERLFMALVLVIPPGARAELYEYEYSSEASEEGS